MNLDVLTTNNGHEGILLCIELQPKLLFMDIRMPVLDGFKAAGILKTRPDTSRIPIIALTASPTKQEKKMALSSGFSGYLSKPLELGSLLSEICRYLRYESLNKQISGEQKKSEHLICLAKANQPDLLCRQLKHDISPCFENLKRAFVASDFKTIGEKLNTMGEIFSIKELSDMGNHMLDLLTAFDIKKMQSCLNYYAKVIETSIRNLEASDEP